MTHARHALLVAGWEFRRYFKWRDQVLGLLVFLVLAGAGYLAGRVATAGGRTMTVAVAGIDGPSIDALSAGTRLRFVPAPEEAHRPAALRDGSVQGVLSRETDGSFDLLVEKDPRFLSDLQALLDALVRRERLATRGVTEAELARILTPAQIAIRFADPARGRAGRGERLIAGISTAIVLFAVFTAMAYLLTGITGEKQLRVTESIVSIVPPQAWIDGKILGIGAYSLVNVVNIIIGSMLIALAAKTAWGFTLPDAAARPGILLILLTFSALGLLLWNAFFAAFAATIDDPNTSARTSFMFLPVIFMGMAGWTVLRDPDSTVSRALAIFPLTSSPALPIRAILADVGLPELALSVALLIATIWLVRRAAGRIFEIGMLMYGKEPTLREILRWARRP
jgi:ABC-2 type transport system permease protein